MKSCITRSLALFVLLNTPALLDAAEPTRPTAVEPAKAHFVLAGDSTVTDTAGWGKAFAERLAGGAKCTNLARGGQSTKSFIDSGNWAKVIAAQPTHVLIQFGHNDQPGKGPQRETDPATTYRANLIRMIDESRAAGAQPIIVTSLIRRVFDGDKIRDTLKDYADAARAVARDKQVPLVDLHARSIELCNRLGPTASDKFNPAAEPGKHDRTHLNDKGAKVFAAIVVDELLKASPELAACFKRD